MLSLIKKMALMMKKSKKIILVLICCLSFLQFIYISRAYAENMNLQVNVVARKSTDTMNDFDFSKMNESNSEVQGQVAGATSAMPAPAEHSAHWDSFVSKIVSFFKNIL